MKLTQRLLTMYVLLTILPLLAMGGLAGYMGERAIENQVYDRLLAINNLKQRELHRWQDDSISTISLLAQRPLVVEYSAKLVKAAAYDQLTSGQQNYHDLLLKDHFQPTLNMQNSFDEFFIIRASDGQILLATDPELEGVFRENTIFFQQGLRNVYIEPPNYLIRSQELVMHVSAPIRNAAGETIAVLVGNLNMNELITIIGQTNLFSETEDSYLVDNNHYFITEPRFGEGYQYTQTVFTEGVDRCLHKQSGQGLYTDYRGELVYGVFTWLENEGICSITEIDQAEIAQDIARMRAASIAISLLMIIAMLVVGLAFSRDILSGLHRVEKGAKAITDGNLSFRIQSKRKDEFGMLAQRFNEMAENLEASGQRNQELIEQLNQANESLEDQVEERTKDLKDAQLATLNMMEDLLKNQEALSEKSKELKRSNKDLEQFAYVASHDLQEPLRMVSSYLQLIERRYKGQLDQDADDFIAFAVDGAARMKSLLNDLLEFSRVGTRGKDPSPVSSQIIMQQVLDDLQFAIADARAEIHIDTLPQVLADPSQLSQLFQNLLGNALKFHNTGTPKINVSAKPAKDAEGEAIWEFAVTDNGIGIDPQYFERIFIVFQRLHPPENYPGTGIGLSICKRIVERHGGRIWLESTPGESTTFFFTLKAA